MKDLFERDFSCGNSLFVAIGEKLVEDMPIRRHAQAKIFVLRQ